MKSTVSIVSCVLAVVFVACGPKATETPQPELPNPASVYCEEQGYQVEIRAADDDGSQQRFYVFLIAATRPAMLRNRDNTTLLALEPSIGAARGSPIPSGHHSLA